MNKYNIKDSVFAINLKTNFIESGVIRKIIIEEKRVCYEVAIAGFDNIRSEIFAEDLIGRTWNELYQYLRDNIEKFFPVV